MSSPEQLLASFDAKIAEVKQRGDRMQAEMAAVSVSEKPLAMRSITDCGPWRMPL